MDEQSNQPQQKPQQEDSPLPPQPTSEQLARMNQSEVITPSSIQPQQNQPAENISNPVVASDQETTPAIEPMVQPAISPNHVAGTSNHTATDQPLQSQQPQVSVPEMSSAPPVFPDKPKTRKAKLLIPIIVGVLLILGGTAAAYNQLVLNSPSGIWSKALSNTAAGFDRLVEMAAEEPAKGGSVQGTFKLSSPQVIDGTFNGQWYETSAQYSLDVGIAGVRPRIELRTIPMSAGVTPDAYVKIENLAPISDLLGNSPQLAGLINEVDGNWYMIDHTLYEQALLGSTSASNPELTQDEIKEITQKLSTLMREYVFTDDSQKAIVVVDEAVGKEEFAGVPAYKYIVRLQKEQTKSFVTALVNSLKGTKAEELLGGSENGIALEEALNLDAFLNELEDQGFTDATAEAWVNMDTKLIHTIRITPESNNDDTGYIDLSMPYDGGDEIPLSIRINYETAAQESAMDSTVTLTYNMNTQAVGVRMNLNASENGQAIAAEGALTATPSNEAVTIETPTGARNIYELLGVLYGGYNPAQLDDSFYDTVPGGTLGVTDEPGDTIPFFERFNLEDILL